jgi:hypothetical protein
MPSFKFHFQEIDWVIYLPSHGNERRTHQKYGVAYHDRKKGRSQPGRRIGLKEALEKSEINKKYPHTVGFFLKSKGKGKSWKPDYLRTKKIRSQRKFYGFLKELGL